MNNRLLKPSLMRFVVIYLLGFFVLLFSGHSCLSQVFENSAGGREKRFIYEVKQIDEFFERFNDDTSSFIRGVYKSYRTKFNIDRPSLIKSLFNYQTKTWSRSSIDSFVSTAMSTRMPSRENFYGENWFAEATCKFLYEAGEIEIPVILRIYTDDLRRSKWMITGVGSNPIKPVSAAIPNILEKNIQKFINPSSHANYFIELGKVFEDKENLSSYFDNFFFSRNNAVTFYNALLNGTIKFMHVKNIKYHFLQVSDYIFTVEYFQRKELNAGWLINSLYQATTADKNNFTKNLLGE